MRIFAYLVLLLLSVAPLSGQVIPASDVQPKLRSSSGAALARQVGVGERAEVKLWTSTVPVTFSRLVQDDGDDWKIGPEISLGGSYVYMVGEGTGLGNGSMQLDPRFFTGPVLQIGFAEDVDDGALAATFLAGAVLGYRDVAGLVGYDFLEGSIVLGAGTKVTTLIIDNIRSIVVE
jgi:hypothetical protein